MISKSKIKYNKSLKHKKHRRLNGELLIEGARIISSALEANAYFKTVLLTNVFKHFPSSRYIMNELN